MAFQIVREISNGVAAIMYKQCVSAGWLHSVLGLGDDDPLAMAVVPRGSEERRYSYIVMFNRACNETFHPLFRHHG